MVCDVSAEAVAPLRRSRGAPRGVARPRSVRAARSCRSWCATTTRSARSSRARRHPGRRRAGHGRRHPLHDPGRDRRASWRPSWRRAGVAVVDAPVSGGVVGRPRGHAGRDGRRRRRRASIAAGEAFELLVGPHRPHGPGRRRHPGQARPQPAPLRGVHRRRRGAAPGRGRRRQTCARLGRGHPATPTSITGGPSIVFLRPTPRRWPPTTRSYGALSHAVVLGEKDLALALELGRELGVDLPMAALARDHLAAALGVPPTDDRTTITTIRRSRPGGRPVTDEKRQLGLETMAQGLRLGRGGRRARRLLRLHRRPPLRRDLDPRGAVVPRPAPAAARPGRRVRASTTCIGAPGAGGARQRRARRPTSCARSSSSSPTTPVGPRAPSSTPRSRRRSPATPSVAATPRSQPRRRISRRLTRTLGRPDPRRPRR